MSTQEAKEMPPETLAALKGSIEKWRGIVAGTEKDLGYQNCPLCQMFFVTADSNDDFPCEGCPVADFTGQMGCVGSPYDDWSSVTNHCRTADTPARKAAAQAELDFLISLLPEGAAA